MIEESNRYCAEDELWICPHCGRHVENDRYRFDDESCMLNAVKVKEKDCVYKDGNKNMRVIEVKGNYAE